MAIIKNNLKNFYRFKQEKPGKLIIYLQDRLDVSNAASLIKELNTLLRIHKPGNLVVDLEKLEHLDDFGVAVIAGLKKSMGDRRGRFSFINISETIGKVFTMHRFDVLGQQTVSEYKPSQNIFTRLGDVTLNFVKEQAFTLTFLGDTCMSFLRLLRYPLSLRFNDTLENMQRVGMNALPIVGLISFLLGLIIAFMLADQLQQLGASIFVATLVGKSMTRELGPIITAIIVAGRSGSAFAAEIGTMKISEEIDALFTMGLKPHFFLVLPRMIATCLVVPVLTLFSDLLAIIGGLLVGISMLDLTINGYIIQTTATISIFDVFWGVFKSFIFAMLISWTGCLRGFQVTGGAAGVGRATTSAVVSGIFLIILSDSLLAVILKYWNG